jgi:hypothetical protein
MRWWIAAAAGFADPELKTANTLGARQSNASCSDTAIHEFARDHACQAFECAREKCDGSSYPTASAIAIIGTTQFAPHMLQR